jgi:hypothetical protein
MCPACVSTALLIAGSVASAGGLAAAAIKTLGPKKAGDYRVAGPTRDRPRSASRRSWRAVHLCRSGPRLSSPHAELRGDRFWKRSICLWKRTHTSFDRFPVVLERLEDCVALLMRQADVAKACGMEHALEAARVGQNEGEMKIVAMIRKIAAERVGKNAPHRRAFRGGDHANRGASTAAQDSTELGQTSRRIRKEHQAELTDDAIKSAIGKSQRLTIHSSGSKPLPGKPRTGRIEHRRRDVHADHESSGSNP